MPTQALLTAQSVILNVSLRAIVSEHGRCVICEEGGEDVINERQVKIEGQILCRACAGGAYYEMKEEPLHWEHALLAEIPGMIPA